MFDLRNTKYTIEEKLSTLFKLNSEEIELVSKSVLEDLVAKEDDRLTLPLAYAYRNDEELSFKIISLY
ncbi:hypothetical protein CL657_01130 [bacterium]|nr:hypothetical protein [bacterium]